METNNMEAPVGMSSLKYTAISVDDVQLDPLNQAIVIAPLPILPPDGGAKCKVPSRKANVALWSYIIMVNI